METVNDLSSVMQLMLALVAFGGAVAGGVLWAIKICVEKLLKDIKDELSDIRVIILQHANSHKLHAELIVQLEEKTESHEERIILLEEVHLKRIS